MARTPPVCDQEMEIEIRNLPDEVIAGPSPYLAGSAEKIFWLQERWKRFAKCIPIHQNSGEHPSFMHHKGDLRHASTVERVTKRAQEPRQIVTKRHLPD